MIVVRGEVDLGTADALSSALKVAVEQGGDAVVLDLSETWLVDSTGLSVLLNGFGD